ncbi:high choriolytic enzyme 1-like [Conger conger]|uniref:high choriolytic enzyme 1-like n=1 Tax=Conger conger TaxID=82655 RepID=UPI002A598390|nr:high choriolytic enzyme 1-like [Conger conger]
MTFFTFSVGVLTLLLVSSTRADEDLSVSTLLEKANRNVVHDPDEPTIVDDIAIPTFPEKNADPCTSRGCMWPKYSDGKIYVPYVIANHYSSRELAVIERGLESFASSTCIRFTRRTNQRDYLYIQSHNGCYSYVGRVGGSQVVSLSRQGCIYYGTVQHELLHALGFNHEQTRSDRDYHVRVLLHNVISGMEHNFNKIDTNNLGTPYDYGSVMQYHRFAFSKNNEPTMVPIPDNNVEIGAATQMSYNDIARINRLYQC